MAANKKRKGPAPRKAPKKKPYLTRKEIIITVTVVVVILVGWFLFEKLYDDGALKTVDGVAQVSGEHSMLINTNTVQVPRYFKLGQAGEVAGYALETVPYALDAENIKSYNYAPEDEAAVFAKVSVNGSYLAADKYAESMNDARANAENCTCSELSKVSIRERNALYQTYVLAPSEEETQYTKGLDLFISVGERSIFFTFYASADSEEALPDDAALFEATQVFTDALSFETV